MNKLYEEANKTKHGDNDNWYVCLKPKTYRIYFINNWKTADFKREINFCHRDESDGICFILN